MSKEIKKLMIDALAENFKEVKECIVIDISTLDSAETTEFRSSMRESEISVTGVKTSLARHAMKGTDLQEASELLQGQSYVASSPNDVVSLAKELVKWSKENEKVVIKGGFYEGQLVDSSGVVGLSKLPSRDELLAGIVVKALSPGQSLLGQLNTTGSSILGAIESLVERLEKEAV